KRDGKEGNQEQAEQHSQRLYRSESQPEPALLALCLLSERRAQIVGHFRHGPPRITGADDTTAGQGHGTSGLSRCWLESQLTPLLPPSKKGDPKAALLFK